MAIITISRELAALGDETAQEVAKLLGYRFVDKQIIEHAITSRGFSEKKLEKYDERKPTFWASLSQDRDDYIHYLKAALYSEAVKGNCVFMGRGAGAIFKDLPATLSIRLVAPMSIRINRVKSYFRCDDKRARQIVDQSDHDRAGFHKYFFDFDLSKAEYFHVTLNTGAMHPSLVAKIIKSLADSIVTEEAEKLSQVKLKELVLAQEVEHHILYIRKIPIHFLEVSSTDDSVVLHGVANSQASVESALAAAKEVSKVRSVQSEIQVVQEYSVMP